MKRFAVAIIMWLVVGCSSGYEVFDVAKMEKDPNGIPIRQTKNLLYYALPRHVVNVDVPVTQVKTAAPKLCPDGSYRAELLIDDDDVLKTAETFELGEAVVTTFSEADPAAVYGVSFDRAPLHKLNHIFELTEGGLLSTGKSSVENQAADLAVSVIKGVAGIAGAVIGAGAPTPQPGQQLTGPDLCKQLVIDIKAMRAKRDTLLLSERNAVPTSKEALEYSITQLASREEDLLGHFLGTKTKKAVSVHCEFTPSNSSLSSTLFNFSAKHGVSGQVSGCVVPPVATGKNSDPDSTFPVKLGISRDPAVQFPGVVGAVRKDLGKAEGLFYRIPATTLAIVEWGGTSVSGNAAKASVLRGRTRLAVAQLGVVNAFPGGKEAKDFKNTYQAVLYPASGALQKLDLTAESGGTAAVATAVGEGAQTVITARGTRDAAEATARKAEETAAAAEEKLASDELVQLERQRKILEEKKKILDLQKELAKAPQP